MTGSIPLDHTSCPQTKGLQHKYDVSSNTLISHFFNLLNSHDLPLCSASATSKEGHTLDIAITHKCSASTIKNSDNSLNDHNLLSFHLFLCLTPPKHVLHHPCDLQTLHHLSTFPGHHTWCSYTFFLSQSQPLY